MIASFQTHSLTKCIHDSVVSETSDFISFLLQFFIRFFSSFTQISFKYHQSHSHKPKLNSLEKRRRRQQRRKNCYALPVSVNLCGDILIFTTFLHHIFETHNFRRCVDRQKKKEHFFQSEPQNVAERIFKKSEFVYTCRNRNEFIPAKLRESFFSLNFSPISD